MLYEVCDVNGFMYKIIIYRKKQSILSQIVYKTIVLLLYKKYFQNQTIVTYNFYTSLPLAVKLLLKKKIHLVRTQKKILTFSKGYSKQIYYYLIMM